VTLRRKLAVAAAVLVSPLVASCGFNVATDQVYTPGVGVNERAGSVDVLHALVVSGAEGSGTVIAGLANNDQETPDALMGVTGSSGTQVTPGSPVEIPAGGFVQLANETPISIEGQEITAGSFVTVTFEFERAQSVTVEVPVVERTGDYAEIPVPSVAPTTSAPAEGHGSPTEEGQSTPTEAQTPSEGHSTPAGEPTGGH
jgi:hypothetical protein